MLMVQKPTFTFLLQVVVVICERDLQLQRLMETRHLSERESILLIDTQVRTGMSIKNVSVCRSRQFFVSQDL